jgi:hypothetical protein
MAAKVIATADKVDSEQAGGKTRAMSRKKRRAKARAAAKPELWRSPLVVEEVRETDPDGKIVVHNRLVDTLARMHKSGSISEPMLDAGRKFQRQFIIAQLDPLKAADIARIPGNGREPDPGDTTLGARRQVDGAMRALGGHDAPMGSVAWHVLGLGRSVRDWALRQGWCGRQVRREQGEGMLIAALDLLAEHYGMKTRAAA